MLCTRVSEAVLQGYAVPAWASKSIKSMHARMDAVRNDDLSD
jgi:hypothetical protein